jgi:hypothetical protein
LETEKQTNLYLRLHQVELKTVLNRLNTLVYGQLQTETASSEQFTQIFSLQADRVNLSQHEKNSTVNFKFHQQTEVQEVQDGEKDAESNYDGIASSHSLVHVSFSPPTQLLKDSRKRSHQDLGTSENHDDTYDHNLRPLTFDFDLNRGCKSSDLQQQRPPTRQARPKSTTICIFICTTTGSTYSHFVRSLIFLLSLMISIFPFLRYLFNFFF